jgi:hypothetical protein
MSQHLIVVEFTQKQWEERVAREEARRQRIEPELLKAMEKMEAGVIAAHDKGVEPVIFMLCNCPGAVYVGTQEDYDWYMQDGDCPSPINSVPVDNEYGEDFVWRVNICRSLKEAT